MYTYSDNTTQGFCIFGYYTNHEIMERLTDFWPTEEQAFDQLSGIFVYDDEVMH